MALTRRTITHKFLNSDLTPASGSVEWSLSKRITNGGESIVPSTFSTALNAAGELSQELTSNSDGGTVPTDSRWRVDFRILGAEVETFYITVPTGPGTTDLGSLLPTAPKGG